MAVCLSTAVMFKFRPRRKRISAHFRATGNANISSTANLNF